MISKDPDAMKKQSGSFNFILNTVAAPHNLDAYLELLRRDGTMCGVWEAEQIEECAAAFLQLTGPPDLGSV